MSKKQINKLDMKKGGGCYHVNKKKTKNQFVTLNNRLVKDYNYVRNLKSINIRIN